MAKISTDKKKSLSGVVLIMVVTVMFVLIIMLLATLSVVSTAQNRYYTKYEENQAYYTARSALDVFTNNLLSDKDYYAYDGSTPRVYIHDNNVTTDKMKQGLALQLDLYTITAQSGDNIEQSDLISYANSLVPPKDEYKNYYGTDSTKVQNNGKPKTDPDYKEYIEYRITVFPQVSSATDNYGKMVDTVKNGATDQIEATIRVEVLEREYNLNESKVKDGTYADRNALVASSDFAEAVVKGNRSKDKMRLKVTATVTFMGVESSAVLIYDTNEPPQNNSSRAITTFGGTNLKNMNIVDGISTIDPVSWDNMGNVYGNIYTEGNWHCYSQGPQVYLTDEECFYIGGNATGDNGCFKVKGYAVSDLADKNKRPFIYVGGTYTVQNGKVGGQNGASPTPGEEIDLLTNGIGSAGNAFYINGDVYVKGNADFTGYDSVTITGDLYVDGDLITRENGNAHFGYNAISGSFNKANVAGNVYVSGDIVESGANYPVAFVTTGMNQITAGSIDFTADKDTATSKIDIELPNGVKKSIPSHSENYNNYYKVDSTGAVIVPETPITAEQKAFTKSNDLKIGNYSTKAFTEADVGTTARFFCASNNNGLRKTENGVTTAMPNWEINSSTEVSYVLGSGCGSTAKYGNAEGGSTSNYMYISGGGTINLLLEPGVYWGNIVVADDTQLNIYGPVGNYALDKFAVWTETTFDAYKNNTPLAVGDKAGCNIKVPKINYYFESGSVISAENFLVLTGYFYGPGAEFNAVKQCTNFNLDFNGNSIGSVGLTFIGSVLCKDLIYQNALGGVAYINPALADDSIISGDPIHNWSAHQYARN